ncbi:MAG: hypothetical protein ABSA52_16435 [Candidatus Binatia bacterium]
MAGTVATSITSISFRRGGLFSPRAELLHALPAGLRDDSDGVAATQIATGSLITGVDPPDPDAPYARDLVDAARRFEEARATTSALQRSAVPCP